MIFASLQKTVSKTAETSNDFSLWRIDCLFPSKLGVNSGIPPMYFTEIAPASLRGALGSVHQLFITVAIWVSQILGMPYLLGNTKLWPILISLSVVPAVYQLIALPFCPESPKFLFGNKRDEKGARKGTSIRFLQKKNTWLDLFCWINDRLYLD